MNLKHDIKDLGTLLDYQLSGIQLLREEKINPVMLNAQTNAIGKIAGILKLNLEIAKAMGTKPELMKGFIQAPQLESNSVVKEAKKLVEE